MNNKQKNAFLRCMDLVDKVVREICIFLMFVMLVLVLLQVVSRYFLPGFSVMDRGTGKIYHAMADFPVKQPYCTDLFLYQSNIYHGSTADEGETDFFCYH